MTDVDANADVTPEVVTPDIPRVDEDDDAASEFGSHAVARPRPMVIRSVNTKSRGKGRIKPRLAQVERMGGVDDAAGAIEALASMPRERGTRGPHTDPRVTSHQIARPFASRVAPHQPTVQPLPYPFTAVADHDPDRASGELPTDPPPRYPYYITDDGDRVVPRLDWTDGSQRNRACDLMRR
jgi:hypothetical protein